MEADLLSAEPWARALHQPANGEADQHPQIEGQHQDDQQTDVEAFGSGRRLSERRGGRPSQRAGQRIHRTGSLLLLVGLVVAQLAWVAVLALGVRWIAEALPF